MKRCRPLSDYSNFISNVRLFKVKGKEMADAVHLAINELGDDSPIKDYLQMMEAEVLKSCITEYDEQKVMDKFREEYIAEGLQKGLSDGRTEQAKFSNDQLKTLGMDISQRSKVLGLPEQQLRKWDKEV